MPPSSNTPRICRNNCGACCIIPSITSPLPGAVKGKPAFTPCPHLTEERTCAIFHLKDRPLVCSSLKPQPDLCGNNREEAIELLTAMEIMTSPENPQK